MKNKLYMAPILGISNCIYRNIYDRLFDGYDSAIAPFVSACNVENVNSRVLKDLFPERNTARFELIPQIIGKEAKAFISVAKAMYELGYETVNWNLGCPLKKVRNKQRGSGLLPYPDTIVSILDELIAALPNKVSIKVRLGSEDDTEIFRLLPLLNKIPLKDITIHPRTGLQMYGGTVDVDAFEKALALTTHTVIYNGDIFSKDQFDALVTRFPTINQWMIGRGGVVNPFLPEEIKSIRSCSADEKNIRFKQLHAEIFNTYKEELDGTAHVIAKMKEHWFYWSQAFEQSHKILSKISRSKSESNYSSIVDELFDGPVKLII